MRISSNRLKPPLSCFLKVPGLPGFLGISLIRKCTFAFDHTLTYRFINLSHVTDPRHRDWYCVPRSCNAMYSYIMLSFILKPQNSCLPVSVVLINLPVRCHEIKTWFFLRQQQHIIFQKHPPGHPYEPRTSLTVISQELDRILRPPQKSRWNDLMSLVLQFTRHRVLTVFQVLFLLFTFLQKHQCLLSFIPKSKTSLPLSTD
jgi:hypothetical protein